MEKTQKGRAPAVLAVCGVFLFCLCIFPLGFACVLFFPIDTAGCYSDAASYTVVEGRLERPEEIGGKLFFNLQTDDSGPDLYTECYLCAENAAIAQANAFGTEVSEGDAVTVLVALQIFYDGGDFPVIALSANGKEYLPQEIGLQNQAAYSRAADASDLAMFRKIFFPALAVQIVALGMSVAGTVWKKKGEKRDCPPA